MNLGPNENYYGDNNYYKTSANPNENYYGDNNYFETGIGPTTDKILNTVLDRLATDKFKEKLTDKIVDPITEIINEKIKPYVYVSVGLYGIIIALLVIIIYLIMKNRKNIKM